MGDNKCMGEYIYLFICMISLLISGMLVWECSNTRYIEGECDSHNYSTRNITQPISPLLSLIMEPYLFPLARRKLNPDAKVFTPRKENTKYNFV